MDRSLRSTFLRVISAHHGLPVVVVVVVVVVSGRRGVVAGVGRMKPLTPAAASSRRRPAARIVRGIEGRSVRCCLLWSYVVCYKGLGVGGVVCACHDECRQQEHTWNNRARAHRSLRSSDVRCWVVTCQRRLIDASDGGSIDIN